MNDMHFTREEQELAYQWADDPSWVRQQSYEHDKEYLRCVQDILAHPRFQSMDQFMQHGDTTCKEHCIKVSYMSYCICRKKEWDYVQAARGGLLHDFFLYDWHTHAKETGEHFHGFTHPGTALRNAEKYFALTDKEKDMIRCHMWPLTPVPPKSREGFSIIYADKFCGLVETGARVKRWVLFGIMLRRTA